MSKSVSRKPWDTPTPCTGLSINTRRRLYWLWGWKFEGEFPDEMKKAVIIAAPHTSNWDFIVAVLVVFGLDIRLSIFGKHKLFWWPFSVFLRWMGVEPVNKHQNWGMVETAVERFENRDAFIMAMAPEGTRSAVPKWRTGYFQIATAAQVPVLPVGINYEAKRLCIFDSYWLTGDEATDTAHLHSLFVDQIGKRPENWVEK